MYEDQNKIFKKSKNLSILLKSRGRAGKKFSIGEAGYLGELEKFYCTGMGADTLRGLKNLGRGAETLLETMIGR